MSPFFRPLAAVVVVSAFCQPMVAAAKEPTVTLHGPARLGVAKTEAEIEAALDQRISIDLTGESIKEFINALGKRLGVTMAYDKERLLFKILEGSKLLEKDTSDKPISIKLDRVRARLALDLVLEGEHLDWIVDAGRLRITTETEAATKELERTYDIRDLVNPKAPTADIQFLKQVFWIEEIDEKKISATEITVKLSKWEQDDIKQVFSIMRKAKAKLSSKGDGPPAIEVLYAEEISPEEIALHEALVKRDDWSFDKVSFKEIADDVAKRLKINITFNTRALMESGVALDDPISFKAKKAFGRRVFASCSSPAQPHLRNSRQCADNHH